VDGVRRRDVRRQTASRLPSLVDPPRARAEGRYDTPPSRLLVGAASLDVASAPDDISFSASAKNGLSWKEVETRGLRAPPARNFARAWRELLAPARSCGTPWTSADDVKALTQSQLATAWLAGAISPPNLFHPWRRGHRRTPSGLEPGGAAQLPKAVVHHHNSGITAPLDLVRCPDSSGQRPHPAALILSGK
jgi:hypothetical protein